MFKLHSPKDGGVTLTASPFLKVVLTVIAAALCVIALRGFVDPGPLYAQAGLDEMAVYVKSLPGNISVTVSPSWSSFPVEVEGSIDVND
jgi:hypothetical protein